MNEKITVSWDDINRKTNDREDNSLIISGTMGDSRTGYKIGGNRLIFIFLAGVLLAAIAVVCSLLWISNSHKNDPLYTIKVINAIQSQEVLEKNRDYFTSKGYAFYRWALSQKDCNFDQTNDFSMSAPEIDGNVCMQWGTSENDRMAIRLVKGERWQMDDIYIATYQGREINLWATYIMEHPIKAALIVSWPEMLDAFVKGLALGLGM